MLLTLIKPSSISNKIFYLVMILVFHDKNTKKKKDEK